MNLKSLLLATALAAIGTAPAMATPSVAMRLSDGTSTINLPGSCPPAPASCYVSPSQIVFDGPIGNFTLNITTGGDGQSMGQFKAPSIDLYSVNNSSAAGKLTILLTETGFTTSGAGTLLLSNITGSSQGPVTLTYQTWYDGSNTPFGEATPLVNYTSTSPYRTDVANYLDTAAPYSLTEKITIDAAGASSTGFAASMEVPEPASLALLGVGLLGLGMVRRRP